MNNEYVPVRHVSDHAVKNALQFSVVNGDRWSGNIEFIILFVLPIDMVGKACYITHRNTR